MNGPYKGKTHPCSVKYFERGRVVGSMQTNNIILTDEKGDTANVTISNVYQSNGVIHVIDTVLLPN